MRWPAATSSPSPVRKSWLTYGPSWGRPSRPGLRTLTLGKNRWPKLRTFEPLATPTAARDLLCISLASLLSIEEHPSVSTTDPPQLPPDRSPLLTRTTQRRHQPEPPTLICVP